MNRNWLFREVAEIALLVLAASFAGVLLVSAGSCVVGGRAPSLSQSNSTDSEMAPARPLADGNGGDGRPLEEFQPMLAVLAAPSVAPASTVTKSALTATVGTHSYTVPAATVVIDAVPATPPATSNGSGSDLSKLIAASPWPQSLWGTVACIVQRESRGNAGAVGGAGERGLMQIHPATWAYLAQYGITADALFDPATNLRAGYLLFIEAGGLRPWGGGCL